MTIERFTKEEFEAALPKDKSGKPMWECAGLLDGEYVYHIEVRGTNKRITIRSSIDASGVAGDVGQDSIRHWVEYYYKNQWWALGKHDTRWTARTVNWRTHLTEKLQDLYRMALYDSNGRKTKTEQPKIAQPEINSVGLDNVHKWVAFDVACPDAVEHEVGETCGTCGGSFYWDIDTVLGGEEEEVANSLFKANAGKAGIMLVRNSADVGSGDFNRKWAGYKDEFARQEAEEERKAFESDPDYQAHLAGSIHRERGQESVNEFALAPEPAKPVEPNCPQCGSRMVKRHRRSDNQPFWGCSQFPDCRGTRPFTDKVGAPVKPKEFKPTPEQEAIFEYIKDANGTDLVVEALAGTGKTTTIVQALKFTRGKVLFCAFNKKIADELRKRAPRHVNCATLHSVGFAALNKAFPTKPEVDDSKKYGIAKELLPFDDEQMRFARGVLVKVASLVQATLTDPTDREAVLALIEHYGVDTNGSEEMVLQTLPRLIDTSLQRTLVVDYDDMIYMPVVLNIPVEQYDWVFVDECQDLNASQLVLVQRLVNDHGRVVAVGDRHQSIYGFRGADAEAVPRLIRELNETHTLPLTVSWRNPTKVVGLAQSLVPQFQAAPNAIEGEIEEWMDQSQLMRVAREGDLILCRVNAPLVKVCYQFIRQGKTATIVGRDIGKGLVALIDKLKPWDIQDLLVKLRDYKYAEMAKLEASGKENQAQNLEDKCDTLLALCDGVSDLSKLRANIEKIFKSTKVGISLSSVHRAKGLEADHIFILKPELLPFPRAQAPWQIQQEYNIVYVAVTRAIKKLVFVDGPIPPCLLAGAGEEEELEVEDLASENSH